MKKDEITLKNTKQEILDALNEALEREKNNRKMKSDPEQEEKEKKVKAAVQETKKNVDSNIFSTELINKFNDLELAIQEEEDKLKSLYGVESELLNLTLVMNAGKDSLAELELKNKLESEKLEEKIQELEKEYQRKSDELQREFDWKSKTLKVEREREVEEYNYKTKRDREIENNKWEDEKKKRETTLKNMEEEAKKMFSEAKEKVDYLKELEAKVENIPKMLTSEYEKGKMEATTALEKENQYVTDLLKKDYQNTIDRQNDKVESLKEELEKVNQLNLSLQDKLDKAYAEMKELATKTVEANGGVKILGNNQVEGK